jgi:hypothetical protein
MRVASLGSKFSTPFRDSVPLSAGQAPDAPLHGWSQPLGWISHGFDRLAQSHPSAARGLVIGFSISALIWAAIVGFILAL